MKESWSPNCRHLNTTCLECCQFKLFHPFLHELYHVFYIGCRGELKSVPANTGLAMGYTLDTSPVYYIADTQGHTSIQTTCLKDPGDIIRVTTCLFSWVLQDSIQTINLCLCYSCQHGGVNTTSHMTSKALLPHHLPSDKALQWSAFYCRTTTRIALYSYNIWGFQWRLHSLHFANTCTKRQVKILVTFCSL